MAVDGSITIDTSLDNSGFAKDSKELLHAIRSLSAQITSLGQTLQSSFNGYTKAIQEAVSATSQMAAATGQTQAEMTDTGKGVQQATDKAKEGAAQASRAMSNFEHEIQDTRTAIDQLTASSDKPIVQLDEPRQKASALEKDISKLGNSVDKLGPSAQKALASPKQRLDLFRSASASAERELENLREQVEAVGQAKIPTEEYQWLENNVKKAEAALDKMYARQIKMQDLGVKEQSGQWKSLQYDIDMATRMIEDYKGQMQNLKDEGAAFTPGTETQSYQTMSLALDKIKAKLAGVKAEVNRAFGAPSTDAWGQTLTLTDQVKTKVQSLGSALSSMLQRVASAGLSIRNAAAHPLQALNAGLGRVWVKASQVYAGLKRAASSAIHAGLQKIGSAAKNVAKNLAGMVKNSVINGVKKLAGGLFHVGSGAKASNSGLAIGLKSMLKYGLGVRSLFALLNKLRRAFTEGAGNYAKFDSGFNTAVSNFISALKTLRNAFVSAFAPVVEFVLPILTTLINAITEAVNRIGMLISALTGKSFFKQAAKVQYDYAGAAADSAGAMEDEADAAKEAQKQLAGFDDVEILKADDQSGSKGSGGNGGSGGDMGGFSDVPIENSMSDLAKKLKEAWAKADFTEIGRMLGEKFRDALESIPWPKIKKTLQKVAKCTATFLNGFLETPGLFSVIGKTIAEGINSAFEFVHSFVTNFHWKSLGYAVRDSIVGVFNALDWSLIEDTFIGLGLGLGAALSAALDNPEIWNGAFITATNALNSLIYGIDAFLKSVNWFSLAANVARGLNAGLINMDWTALGKTCADAVNTLFNLFNGFVSTTDWGLLSASIISTIGAFFGNIDWGIVGNALSNACSALFDFLSSALATINWEELPQAICQAIGSFLAGFDWSKFVSSLAKLLGSAFVAAVRIGSGLWTTLLDFGKSVIEGGWQGMIDKMKSIGSWIKKNILDPFIAGFKSAFGIHSPATVMMPLGENIIQGVLTGIKRVWHIITDFFVQCGSSISNVWSRLTSWWESIGNNLVTGIWNGIAGSWDWLCSSVSGLCSNLWNSFCKFWDIRSPSHLMEDGGEYIGKGAAKGITNTVRENVTAVQNLGKAMHKEASRIEPIDLKAGIQGSLAGLDGSLLDFSDRVVAAFERVVSQIAAIGAPAFSVPAFASGSVVPYRTGTSSRSTDEILNRILSAKDDSLTKDDLVSALAPVIEAIKLYAGTFLSDEQLARAANRGQDKLSRRFSPSDK